MMEKPILSIGLIFRDDIRCIERCLKALQPLRDALPCELVMADTGSADGSRAVAATYADVLFDFPWIDDFAAARNAVMDRCSGEWFLSVDTDEYLADCSELVRFLCSNLSVNLCRVVVRNYSSYEMDGAYSDFLAVRLVRMSAGVRYEGIIHESWTGVEKAGKIMRLAKTVFHHDGYVNMDQNTEKLKRNVTLLREKLRRDPKSLLVHLQFLESGSNELDYVEQIRKAVFLVRRKGTDWQFYGPPILRQAVIAAQKRRLPEFEKWADMAETWFPDSYFTRIDVACQRQIWDFMDKNYAACVARGGAIQAAYDDYFAGRGDLSCQAASTLRMGSPYYERNQQMMLANAYVEEGQPEAASALLKKLDCAAMDGAQADNYAKILCILRSRSHADTDGLVLALWESLNDTAAPPKKTAEKRKAFFSLASKVFAVAFRASELGKAGFCRPAYTVFSALRGVCGLGTGAAVMMSKDPAEMEALLESLENWAELPIPALSHALRAGVRFPLPDKRFALEELDGFALRLAQDKTALNVILKKAASEDYAGNWQTLTWVRGLALSAVQSCDWKDVEEGMALARIFAKAEGIFISACYSPEVLREGSLFVLPAMHRFGWHCAQAFAALEAGDTMGYVRLLRAGLAVSTEMKPMVEFLMEHTPELRAARDDKELRDLAEKVKELLAAYPPNDPAVAALKASLAYQKVAYLIEGEGI